MAATCKLLSFASVIPTVSPYCLAVIYGSEVDGSDLPKGCH